MSKYCPKWKWNDPTRMANMCHEKNRARSRLSRPTEKNDCLLAARTEREKNPYQLSTLHNILISCYCGSSVSQTSAQFEFRFSLFCSTPCALPTLVNSLWLWIFIFAQRVRASEKSAIINTALCVCLCAQTKCINFICASTECINAHTKRHGELVPTQLQWKIARHKMKCTTILYCVCCAVLYGVSMLARLICIYLCNIINIVVITWEISISGPMHAVKRTAQTTAMEYIYFVFFFWQTLLSCKCVRMFFAHICSRSTSPARSGPACSPSQLRPSS